MLGTTGEGIMLTRDERRRVAELTMAGAGDPAPLEEYDAGSSGPV